MPRHATEQLGTSPAYYCMIYVHFIITEYYQCCIVTIKTAYCICHTAVKIILRVRQALPGNVTNFQPVLSS